MAPLERGNGPVPSERSSEVDDRRVRDREDSNSSGSGSSSSGSSSSGSSSSSTSSSSSNSSSKSSSSSSTSSSSSSSSRRSSSKSSSKSSGGNSSISDTVSRDDTVADRTVNRDKANYQEGHTEEGRSGDTNTAGTQQSQVHATSARSEARDATKSSARLEGGDSGSTPSPLPTTSVRSNEIRRGLSGASVASIEAGVGRERRGSRAAVFNAADARVKAGQLSRAGSTRATTAGSRVEVRGELEVTNVSSAQELIQLLEDSSSPFALQLQNVELRVGPSQSVRLGEAVPALREHLRRDLQRQLRQAAGPDGDTQSRVSTSGRHSASRDGASVSSPRHSSNILLTGTVIGGAHPRLLSSREGPGATAKTSAVSRPQALIGREAAPARSIPSGERSAVSVVAASGVAATHRTDDGEATSVAAVSVPVSAAVAEQAQQQRASAEATSLVQQILEVQGQVKSLLAEEGLSPVAAEAGALKKKKGAQEDAEDERRPGQRISGNSGPPGGSLNDSTHGGRAPGGGAGSSSSAFSIPGSSGSSGSRTSVRGSLMPKAAPVLQQNSGAAAAVKEITDGDAGGEYSGSSGTERREKVESAAEEASPIEGTKVKTVARTRKSTADEGEGRKEESDAVQQEKGKEEEEQSGRGVAVSAGRRSQGSLQTNVDQARIEVTAETSSPVDVKDAQAEDSEDAEAAEGTAAVTQRGPIEGAAGARGGARVTEKKDHTVSTEKANETKQRTRGRTREAEVRGTGGGARGDNGRPEPDAPAAKEREGGAKQGSWEETKEDRRSSTGPDESAGMTTDQASAHSERIGSAHEAVDEQKRVPPGETLGELPEVNVPGVVPKEESEGLAISEQQGGQVKEEAEKPSGGKPFLTKPGTDGTSPRAARGPKSSTERREQERRVGGSSEKSVTHESEVQEQASAAAAASPAPTFVQALSSFFTWGAADDETKPSPAPKNEVEANEKKVSGEGEADKETTKGPAVRPEQVGAPAPTTAEKGGKGVEGQNRKEPKPKLKPKAPPAGIALSKRDKE